MLDAFDFRGLVAVVTGGSGWLGGAMVEALSAAGAHVVAVARDAERADRALQDMARVSVRSCDVTSSAWPRLLADVADSHGRIDVLVNNAHVGRGGSLRLADPDAYREALELAVVAAAVGMNAAARQVRPRLAAGGRPSVINVSSMYGVVAPDPEVYAVRGGAQPAVLRRRQGGPATAHQVRRCRARPGRHPC